MALRDLSDPGAVAAALVEFDRKGREAFLEEHGFKPARSYFLEVDGREYDSKAIAGVAHGYQFPTLGSLRPSDFSGGDATVARVLRRMGFVVGRGSDGARRNPSWAVDELVLALELYLRCGLLDDTDPRTIELSEVLNSLPIHTERPDEERFRNPNGVALKLANFAALDPDYPGAGMSRGGRRDAEVWDRFRNKPGELAAVARALRDGAAGPDSFPAVSEEDEDEVAEGRLLYRRHRARERNRTLVAKKKAAALAKGTLSCEVCGFDFENTYGPLGNGFIECHHKQPLSLSGSTSTRLGDLALLCSNCHRMAHRGKPWPSVLELARIVRQRL